MMTQQNNDFYADVFSRSSSVTGSCTLISIHFPNKKNYRILVDCGVFQGGDTRESILNEVIPFDTKKIDSVFITHNHIDHIGLLPLLVKQGYENPIFTTVGTFRLIDIALYDSCRIKDTSIGETLYTQEDVEKTLDLLVGCSYKNILKPHKHVHVILYPNGHLIGAAIILVKISYPGRDDINLLFTGDYNNKNKFFNVPPLPQKVKSTPITTLFTESTYGDMDSTDPLLKPCLVDNIAEAVWSGKTVIFPAFSQGRYQEILLILKLMQEEDLLPEEICIYGDGYTGQEYTNRYLYNDLGIKKLYQNFLPRNLIMIDRKDRKIMREKIINDPKPKIIISPGGMGSYGSIQKYISSYLSREDALIHYLGYCSPESHASKLIEAEHGEEVLYSGMMYTKKCDIKWTGELSAHAKRDELLAFTKSFSNLKSVLITHGEPEVKKKYAGYLRENLSDETKIGILNSDYAYRITENGIDKTFPTHFQL